MTTLACLCLLVQGMLVHHHTCFMTSCHPAQAFVHGRQILCLLGYNPAYVLKLFVGIFVTRRWDSWSHCLQWGSRVGGTWYSRVSLFCLHTSPPPCCLNLVTPFGYSLIVSWHTQRVCLHDDSKSDQPDMITMIMPSANKKGYLSSQLEWLSCWLVIGSCFSLV